MNYIEKNIKEIEEDIFLNNTPLDDFEKELLEEINKWNFEKVENQEEEKEKLYQATMNTITKKKAISIKPLESDIFKIKSIALKKWIPYQTFINSILHQVATGVIKV